MDSQLIKFRVYGELTIPFYFPIEEQSKMAALEKVSLILNKKSIKLIDADIYTLNGSIYPLIAPDCRVRLIETLGKDDI